ncbi:hypothetical protein R1flu_025402 [Riccia fluitans]|uniref:Uncharacterized protein n=1 Tax=Riccia fluitans TaxID=41844 RepID=A0ABD1XXM9_9MARC
MPPRAKPSRGRDRGARNLTPPSNVGGGGGQQQPDEGDRRRRKKTEADYEAEEAVGIHQDLCDLPKYQMKCFMEEMVLVRAHLQEGKFHSREMFIGQVLTHILVHLGIYMPEDEGGPSRLVVTSSQSEPKEDKMASAEEDVCQREARVEELSTQIATKPVEVEALMQLGLVDGTFVPCLIPPSSTQQKTLILGVEVCLPVYEGVYTDSMDDSYHPHTESLLQYVASVTDILELTKEVVRMSTNHPYDGVYLTTFDLDIDDDPGFGYLMTTLWS